MLKKGDPVRYTGRSPTYSTPKAIGREGTLTDVKDNVGYVDWNMPEGDRLHLGLAKGVYLENLEKINMKTIDTTKPIETALGSKVTFVTETSDDNILVSLSTSDGWSRDGWIIFNKQGQFVRSNDGERRHLVLRNKIERDVAYQAIRTCYTGGERVGASIYDSFAALRRDGGASDRGDAAIKITRENGVIVAVQLVTGD